MGSLRKWPKFVQVEDWWQSVVKNVLKCIEYFILLSCSIRSAFAFLVYPCLSDQVERRFVLLMKSKKKQLSYNFRLMVVIQEHKNKLTESWSPVSFSLSVKERTDQNTQYGIMSETSILLRTIHMARTRWMYFAHFFGVVRKTFRRAAFFFDNNVLPNSGAMQYAADTMPTTTPHISLSV